MSADAGEFEGHVEGFGKAGMWVIPTCGMAQEVIGSGDER